MKYKCLIVKHTFVETRFNFFCFNSRTVDHLEVRSLSDFCLSNLFHTELQ